MKHSSIWLPLFLFILFTTHSTGNFTMTTSTNSIIKPNSYQGEILARIAFGSCNHAEKRGLWDLIAAHLPDRLMLLGDNVYADSKTGRILKKLQPATPADLHRQYGLLANDRDFLSLVDQVGGMENVLATWDDHDYGINDGDRHYPYRNESKEIFLDFFRVPLNHPRRKQQGVYWAQTVFAANLTYKMIVMDVRFNRDSYGESDGDFLGAEQWQWLRQELDDATPDLILLGSSIQVLPEGKVVEESWSKFPPMRERLLRLVLSSPVPNVVLLSGDIHTAEILQARCGSSRDRMLTEFTASGLTHTFTESAPYKGKSAHSGSSSKGLFKKSVYAIYQTLFPHFYREGPQDHYQKVHFGLIDVVHIDSESGAENGKAVVLQVIGADGTSVMRRVLPLKPRHSANTCLITDTSENTSVCEPFWGDIPKWRLWLCVAGLSLIPVVSFGAPLGLAAVLLRVLVRTAWQFIYRKN